MISLNTRHNLRLALDSWYTEIKNNVIILKEKIENIECIIKISSIDSMTAWYKIKQNLSKSSYIKWSIFKIYVNDCITS